MAEEFAIAREFTSRLDLRAAALDQHVGNLSGGNQQKVVLSKWLFANPDVLILDEPTRGIDVGAKYEIYSIMNNLADDGRGVIMISSEMPEVLSVSDRILAMYEGKIVQEFTSETVTENGLVTAITGQAV